MWLEIVRAARVKRGLKRVASGAGRRVSEAECDSSSSSSDSEVDFGCVRGARTLSSSSR